MDPKCPEKGRFLRRVHTIRSQFFCASNAVVLGRGTEPCGQLRLNVRNCLRHSCCRKALTSSFLRFDSDTRIVSILEVSYHSFSVACDLVEYVLCLRMS